MPAGTVSSRARLSIIAALLVCAFVTPSSVTMRAESQNARKLGPLAAERAARGTGRSTVIIRATNGGAARAAALEAGGTLGRSLPGMNGQVVTLPDAALARLADNPAIERISLDRLAVGANERTGATVGATQVRQELGLDGAGIGIAVIDSGIAYHDDLADASGRSASIDSSISWAASRRPTTITVTARTSPASSPATATTPTGSARALLPRHG